MGSRRLAATTMSGTSFGLPLAGYRVLDLSRYGPGPYCSMLLGDLGAEIVVIDDGSRRSARRESDASRTTNSDVTKPLEYMRRNARRIALDLKHPDGLLVAERLASASDVFIESFRPGVAERLGLGHLELKKRHPRLVYCSISGYGQSGPYRGWQGHDINYVALGGLLSLTGHAGGDPALPGTLVADLAGGALPAAVAILSALLERERSGLGQYIDVSLQEGVVGLLSPMIALALAGWTAGRGTSVLSGGAPWYRVYATVDERFVAVGAIEPWLYAKLCNQLDHPEWIEHQYDEAEWPAISDEMASIFAGKPLDYWREHLEPAGVCLTGVHDMDDIFNDPQLNHRGTFGTGDPDPVHIRSLPLMSRVTERTTRSPSPSGGDADAILTEAGFSLDERRRLRESGGVS